MLAKNSQKLKYQQWRSYGAPSSGKRLDPPLAHIVQSLKGFCKIGGTKLYVGGRRNGTALTQTATGNRGSSFQLEDDVIMDYLM